ncbi:MAG: PilZ domain-containing protein [Terriglobales bacterium]
MDSIQERRRYERVRLPDTANVVVCNREGKTIGRVRTIGQGGLAIETEEKFTQLSRIHIRLVDESEGIRRELDAAVRYHTPDGIGIEFLGLSTDAAVEIGVIIGKYYSAAHGAGA